VNRRTKAELSENGRLAVIIRHDGPDAAQAAAEARARMLVLQARRHLAEAIDEYAQAEQQLQDLGMADVTPAGDGHG